MLYKAMYANQSICNALDIKLLTQATCEMFVFDYLITKLTCNWITLIYLIIHLQKVCELLAKQLQNNRVSKTHTWKNVFTKIIQNLFNILPFEQRTCKTGTFSYFWHNLTTFFLIFYVKIAILVHNSAQNNIKLNSDRPKKIYFYNICKTHAWGFFISKTLAYFWHNQTKFFFKYFMLKQQFKCITLRKILSS